ncbi:MAG: hypothetical protein FWF81_05045 [Defluviitaleaceae bacterium]|nr:hypothetical protein [Defluviitaleaceae bacterium]
MNRKTMQELENGTIQPRTQMSAPKKAVASAIEPTIKGAAEFWGWRAACHFFLHQPTLPKKLQDPQDME